MFLNRMSKLANDVRTSVRLARYRCAISRGWRRLRGPLLAVAIGMLLALAFPPSQETAEPEEGVFPVATRWGHGFMLGGDGRLRNDLGTDYPPPRGELETIIVDEFMSGFRDRSMEVWATLPGDDEAKMNALRLLVDRGRALEAYRHDIEPEAYTWMESPRLRSPNEDIIALSALIDSQQSPDLRVALQQNVEKEKADLEQFAAAEKVVLEKAKEFFIDATTAVATLPASEERASMYFAISRNQRLLRDDKLAEQNFALGKIDLANAGNSLIPWNWATMRVLLFGGLAFVVYQFFGGMINKFGDATGGYALSKWPRRSSTVADGASHDGA